MINMHSITEKITNNDYSTYSLGEKLTIINLLLLAGICDHDGNNPNFSKLEKELHFLNCYVELFDVSAKDADCHIKEIGLEGLLHKFKEMNDSKIENTILLILNMMNADGKINESEITFLEQLLRQVDVSIDSLGLRFHKNEMMYDY